METNGLRLARALNKDMTFIRKSLITVAALCLATSALSADSTYPSRTVRLVVGFAPGGPTDVVARIVAEGLSRELKQAFIIENKPAAGGVIAASDVAKATPDGYTVLFSGVNHTLNPAMFDKLPYDSVNDFSPVAVVATSPSLLVVRPDFPAKTYAEFVSLLKQSPGKYSVASTGGSRFTAELFMLEAGVNLINAVYKGAAPAMNDVMAGHADMSFATLGSVQPLVDAGKLRAIAIAAEKRVETLPAVPTFSESGLPGFRLDGWFGVLLPSGTPAEVTRRLGDAARKVSSSPDFRERIRPQGLSPVLNSEPTAFKKQIEAELKTYQAIGTKIGKAKFN